VPVYLSCAALPTDHQGLVHWLQLALDIPVGSFCHNKDMWFELLLAKEYLLKRPVISDCQESRQGLHKLPEFK